MAGFDKIVSVYWRENPNSEINLLYHVGDMS